MALTTRSHRRATAPGGSGRGTTAAVNTLVGSTLDDELDAGLESAGPESAGPFVDAPAWVEHIGRGGLVAYGAVHLAVGALAVRIVTLDPRTHADPRGAIAVIARGGAAGRLLLALGVVALVAFACWQIRAAAVGFRWAAPEERWRKRVGAVAKAAGVLSVAWLAARFALHDPGSRRGLRDLVAEVFAHSGGRLLVGAVAVAVLIMSGTMTYTAVRGTFMSDLCPERLAAPGLRRATLVAGSVGNLTRAVTFAVVGLLTADAVIDDDPDRIGGVDLALRTLADHTLGAVALLVTAAGFAAYGLYCGVDAWARHP